MILWLRLRVRISLNGLGAVGLRLLRTLAQSTPRVEILLLSLVARMVSSWVDILPNLNALSRHILIIIIIFEHGSLVALAFR